MKSGTKQKKVKEKQNVNENVKPKSGTLTKIQVGKRKETRKAKSYQRKRQVEKRNVNEKYKVEKWNETEKNKVKRRNVNENV